MDNLAKQCLAGIHLQGAPATFAVITIWTLVSVVALVIVYMQRRRLSRGERLSEKPWALWLAGVSAGLSVPLFALFLYTVTTVRCYG